MKRRIRWWPAIVMLAIPALAFAGSVEDWALPHFEHMDLKQVSIGSTGRLDSSSFYLEGTTSSLAAVYDTVAMKDTLSPIPIQPCMTPEGLDVVGATGDSIFLGALQLTFTSSLAATDTLFISVDALVGGVWVTQATSSVNGWLRAGANRGSAQVVTRNVWLNNGEQLIAAATNTTNAAYSYWGADAIRFRLTIGKSSAVKQVSRARWIQAACGPTKGEIY